jgi:co-chaperonin GroES (HSP10)
VQLLSLKALVHDTPVVICWKHASSSMLGSLGVKLGAAVAVSALLQVNEGVVLAVGPGRRNKDGDLIPTSVKEGDKVLLPEYGGSLIKLDNKE